MRLSLNIVVTLILSVLALFIVYQLTLMWNPFAIQHKTNSFLNAVQEQKFEEAARQFDGTNDREIFAQEMTKLYEQESIRLLSSHNVKAEYDDGSFSTGHADLIFEVDGRQLKVQAILTFSSGARPKQVCAITPPDLKEGSIPQLDSWNRLVCGSIL